MPKVTHPILSLLACLGLFACDPLEKPSGSEDKEPPDGTGRALIHLPSVSKAFRPDTAADSSGGDFLLQLAISGPGMAPIRDAWILHARDLQPVLMPGIPAGAERVFSARLLWLDAARGDSTLTHEGADTVSIRAGATAEVLLLLRKAADTGSAKVCVIVEGLPPDSACGKRVPPVTVIAPPKRDSGFGGCWKVGFRGAQGRLRVWQTGKNLGGSLLWSDGTRDSVSGALEYPYLLINTTGAHGPRRFRGNVLPALRHFEMKLMGTPMGVVEKMIGERADCDTAAHPDSLGNASDTVVSCWKVDQTLGNGKGGSGALFLAKTENAAWGYIRWDGYPEMLITNGPAPVTTSPVYLYGDFPAGMADDPEDAIPRAHYKARLTAAGDSLESGAVYRRSAQGDFTMDDRFGDWGGRRAPCADLFPR
ncbi:MAG: hypothetical protein JWP91_4292 [Fibrobacteres bacterium]|nr:hypothetical protein [Fibrobacterota bacterium]